ncbi:MAG: FAD-dependent oxidoreductase [Planctomycetaceae bacterium]|nr:FAD-dependent oxidoreductase [Planctomycetaceae bacterium]
MHENAANAAKKIAIIGAGPAGLSCAYFLARLGYKPKVFEAEQRPGGMLVQTIPAYRLPREIVAREVRMIERMGVEIQTGVSLGRDFSLQQLRQQGYDAVFLGMGAPDGVRIDIPGDDAEGVFDAMTFLRTYNMRGSAPVGNNVVVIGGGNSAFDAARTALRLGAESVTIVYRRTRDAMPAYNEEIEEAELEGVRLMLLTSPVEILQENGKVIGLKCLPMQLGEFDRSGRRRPKTGSNEPFVVPADQILTAIGQTIELGTVVDEKIDQQREFVRINPVNGATNVPWLFAGGDVVSGPSSVVEAIAAGERAAVGIDAHINGTANPFWRDIRPLDVKFDPDADPSMEPREKPNTIPVERRRYNFDEVELPWTEPIVVRQATRCLRCDYGKRCH